MSYFLNFIASFAAIPQENKVKPIGNTPLVSICGTCSMAMLPEEYIAAAIGKATRPITPSFVFVFSETFSCMLYVLMFIQIVCAVKIRHQLRHDNIDFTPLLEKTNQIIPINTVVADKGYDSENNHIAARDLGIASIIIPPRYSDIPIRKTKGRYRKALKRDGYDNTIYHQRNKVETIFSVIKRMFGDSVTSRNMITINHEMIYRIIAYNCHRIMQNGL